MKTPRNKALHLIAHPSAAAWLSADGIAAGLGVSTEAELDALALSDAGLTIEAREITLRVRRGVLSATDNRIAPVNRRPFRHLAAWVPQSHLAGKADAYEVGQAMQAAPTVTLGLPEVGAVKCEWRNARAEGAKVNPAGFGSLAPRLAERAMGNASRKLDRLGEVAHPLTNHAYFLALSRQFDGLGLSLSPLSPLWRMFARRDWILETAGFACLGIPGLAECARQWCADALPAASVETPLAGKAANCARRRAHASALLVKLRAHSIHAAVAEIGRDCKPFNADGLTSLRDRLPVPNYSATREGRTIRTNSGMRFDLPENADAERIARVAKNEEAGPLTPWGVVSGVCLESGRYGLRIGCHIIALAEVDADADAIAGAHGRNVERVAIGDAIAALPEHRQPFAARDCLAHFSRLIKAADWQPVARALPELPEVAAYLSAVDAEKASAVACEAVRRDAQATPEAKAGASNAWTEAQAARRAAEQVSRAAIQTEFARLSAPLVEKALRCARALTYADYSRELAKAREEAATVTEAALEAEKREGERLRAEHAAAVNAALACFAA